MRIRINLTALILAMFFVTASEVTAENHALILKPKSHETGTRLTGIIKSDVWSQRFGGIIELEPGLIREGLSQLKDRLQESDFTLLYIGDVLTRDEKDPYNSRICGMTLAEIQTNLRLLKGKIVMVFDTPIGKGERDVLKESLELRKCDTLLLVSEKSMKILKIFGTDRDSDGIVTWEEVMANAMDQGADVSSKGTWREAAVNLAKRPNIQGTWSHTYDGELKLRWEGLYIESEYTLAGLPSSLLGWPDGNQIRYRWTKGDAHGTGVFDSVTDMKIDGTWKWEAKNQEGRWTLTRIKKDILNIELEDELSQKMKRLKHNNEDIRAVVVGVAKYDDTRIRPLKYADKDAELFFSMLETNGVKKDAVSLILNEKATKDKIKAELTKMAESDGKVLYLFFSCHGMVAKVENEERLFLACYDTNKENLARTGFGLSDLERVMYVKAKQEFVVCFIDACHSGGTKDNSGYSEKVMESLIGMAEKTHTKDVEREKGFGDKESEKRDPRVAMLASCRANQVSIEDDDLKHGVFTYFLNEGINGAADEDRNGEVTIEEIDGYLYNKVWSKTNRLQRPISRYSYNWSKTTGFKTSGHEKGSTQENASTVKVNDEKIDTDVRITSVKFLDIDKKERSEFKQGERIDMELRWEVRETGREGNPKLKYCVKGPKKLENESRLGEIKKGEDYQDIRLDVDEPGDYQVDVTYEIDGHKCYGKGEFKIYVPSQIIIKGFVTEKKDETPCTSFDESDEIYIRINWQAIGRGKEAIIEITEDQDAVRAITIKRTKGGDDSYRQMLVMRRKSPGDYRIKARALWGDAVDTGGAYFRIVDKGQPEPSEVKFIPDSDWSRAKSHYSRTEDVERASRKQGITYKGVNEQGYLEYVHDKTGLMMVLIPSGSFKIGSPYGEKDRDRDEGPMHEVYLDAYLIGKHEVTQAQWEKVMGNNPSDFKEPQNPVDRVSWNDCKSFCDKLGLTLPSEAQWERACRAGTSTRFYWGDDFEYKEIGEYAWYSGNSGSKTHPVGEKRPNGFGLYDMSGNVWEWCSDLKGSYSSEKESNPTGPSSGFYRMSRGGSWLFDSFCRSAYRIDVDPSLQDSDLGFRCASLIYRP